jgi:predicted metal-dependent peptidase
MTTMKLNAEQRVQKTHVWLMAQPQYCLYSGIFMFGKTSIEENVPTACTNGRDTMYGRAFVDKQKDPELRGLVLHENLHKAFRHLTTWKDLKEKNGKLANMACDYVINLMIVDSDPEGKEVRLPEGGLLDERFRGMDAGEVFRILEKEGKGKGKGKGKGEGGKGDGQGNEQGDGDDTEDNGGPDSNEEEGFDSHDWDGAKEMSDQEKKELERDIDQALRQGAILAGKMKGGVPQQVKDMLESRVDWRDALREFINSFCMDKDVSTWRRPNRRWVDQGVYLPSLTGENVGRIVVACDTSGSMSDVLPKVLGEIKKIAESVRPEGIDLLYWDARVCAVEKYDLDDLDALMTTTRPAGGGGTDPQCVVDYLEDNQLKPECVVMLTDGYVPGWGKGWKVPVIWGITTKGMTADHGVSIHIGEN